MTRPTPKMTILRFQRVYLSKMAKIANFVVSGSMPFPYGHTTNAGPSSPHGPGSKVLFFAWFIQSPLIPQNNPPREKWQIQPKAPDTQKRRAKPKQPIYCRPKAGNSAVLSKSNVSKFKFYLVFALLPVPPVTGSL